MEPAPARGLERRQGQRRRALHVPELEVRRPPHAAPQHALHLRVAPPRQELVEPGQGQRDAEVVGVLLGHAHRLLGRRQRKRRVPEAVVQRRQIQGRVLHDVAARRRLAGGVGPAAVCVCWSVGYVSVWVRGVSKAYLSRGDEPFPLVHSFPPTHTYRRSA